MDLECNFIVWRSTEYDNYGSLVELHYQPQQDVKTGMSGWDGSPDVRAGVRVVSGRQEAGWHGAKLLWHC
jgi:hypothetical protein